MLNVTSERLTIGLVFVVIALLGCLAPVQSDTWWLLRAGLDTWRTGTVSLHDTYSHTATGLYWPNHEWLTSVIFYAAYRAGGMPLLAGLAAAAIIAAWALSWRLTRGSFEVRFLLFAACVATSAGSWAVRPQVFTLLAFALTCTLLVSARYKWLPLLFVLWTNLHGAVALGIVAVGAALAATIVKERKLPRGLTLAALGCVAATLVSPLGFKLWPFVLESMERSKINQLVEWLPPDASAAQWPFWLLAAALVAMTVWRWRRLEAGGARLVAIGLAVLPLAVRSMRNVSVFLLVGVPALTALVAAAAAPERARKALRENARVNAAFLIGGAVVAAVIVTLAWIRPPSQLGWRPIGSPAIEAIRGCDGPVYNTYGQGGELIWFVSEKKVFIDNRQDPYPPALLRANRKLEFDGMYESVFREYGIRCAILPPSSPIVQRLRADAAWSQLYADNSWMVFRRVLRP